MNDLVNRLRLGPYHEPEGVEPENEEQVWNWWCEITDAAANHIEAQEKLIRDLSDCLEDMTKHYVEVRNDLYGFEATEEIEVIAAGKLIALSKSNPNTPERSDE